MTQKSINLFWTVQFNGRLPHWFSTPGKLNGDHAGHLIADLFGGSPYFDNLVSQAQHVNLSEYRVIENEWSKALDDKQTVSVEIWIENDSTGRPTQFKIVYYIDGVRTQRIVSNN